MPGLGRHGARAFDRNAGSHQAPPALVPKHGLGRVGVDPAPGLVQQADVALGGVVPGLGLWQPLLEGASEVLRFIGSDAGGKVGVCRAVAQENGKGSRANGNKPAAPPRRA